jgi:hypothetical protein
MKADEILVQIRDSSEERDVKLVGTEEDVKDALYEIAVTLTLLDFAAMEKGFLEPDWRAAYANNLRRIANQFEGK